MSASTTARSASCAGTRCRCRTREADLPRRHAHHDHGRRRLHPDRHGGARLCSPTQSMEDDHFFNADGELLIVPQEGALRFATEIGVIEVEPGEICVIPRGMVFKVELLDGPARGYVCENYGAKFTLPDRGPIGANCLANPRDFKTPVAGLRGQGDAVPADRQMVRRLPRRPRSAIRRSTSSPGTATTRPTNTTCDLLAGRRDPVRPPRPVDLHRADRAVGDGRHGQRRLRHLPAALAGGRAHVPAALVSHEHHERVHGADPRRLRRQGRRLRAGRHVSLHN